MPAYKDHLHGTLDALILRTLSFGPRHGYAINQWLRDKTGDALEVEEGSLYPALYRMERDGWLERHGCPDDRRRKRIRVTPKAEAVWARMAECCRRVRSQATRGVSEEELAQLKQTCERLRANLELDPPSAEASCLAEAQRSQ